MLARLFEFGTFRFDQLPLIGIRPGLGEHADRNQVFLDDVTQFGDDRRHKFPAGLPVAAARIEYGLELIDEKSHVAAFAKHGRDDPRQSHDPLVVVEVFRIDENFERPPLLELGTFVQDDVVDRDVHRMIRHRCLDLVGGADQHFRPLQLFVHANDFGAIAATTLAAKLRLAGFFLFGGRLADVVADDFFVNFDHCLCPCQAWRVHPAKSVVLR